jgi:pilus assembly protein FimV
VLINTGIKGKPVRKLMIVLAFGAACLLPLDGYTLGLGEIEVNSALNQELDAQIELLSAVPEDAEGLIVKLASREEFSRAGLDRPFLLQDLKFSNVIRDGVPYVKITSGKPIREPFLNFLIEIDWPKGHLLREYTILLDPPVFISDQSVARPAVSDSRPTAAVAQVAAPMPANMTASRPSMAVTAPAGNEPAQMAAPSRQASQADSAATTTSPPAYAAPSRNADYRVRQGDTAWSLADSLRPDQSVSIEQMMLALLRTNPESFINDNVNGLKRGYILRVPERSEITSLSQAEAVAMVRQQNALWREYQQVAGAGASAAASTLSGTGKSADKATKSGDARLSIVSAGKGAASATAGNTESMSADELRAQLALAEERLESERLEKESLQGEVSDLEKQVSKMKRLLSIEDENMAQMQSSLTPSETTEQPTVAETEPEAEPEAESATEPADESTMLTATESETDNTENQAAVTDSEAETAETEQDKVFVDDQNKPQEAAEAEPMDTIAPEPMTAETPPPRGLLVSLFGSPEMLAAVGAGVLLLMGLVYMIVKRRRASSGVDAAMSSKFVDDDLASVADMLDDHAVSQNVSDEEVEASMAAAEAAADEFDSDATMIMPSADDTVITQAEPEEEARDDIIAEADVYLAYGIYQQAEELLQNAIKEHPDNDSYRMKLAETYFAGKNVSGFGELAAEMHKRSKGTGSRWQKIAAMGKDLIPGHELFKGAGANVALDDLVPSPEPMDFDLGLDATGTNEEPDLDFSLDDDSALELPDDSQTDTAILDLEDDSPAAPVEELEFDLSETDATTPEPNEEEFSLDFAASDLDITTDASEKEDDNSLDFDLDLSTEAEASEALDELSGAEAEDDFDIDVSEELGATATIVEKSSASASGNGGDIDLSDLDDVDEVSTKLDLARAYLDMGDHEGTRSILEEVVAEGNAAQKAEAETLLAEIAG